jgi:uncharacterized protein YdhG (YjbR/CyaY superfamily)
MPEKKATTIDEYIAAFPKETQTRLQEIRAVIKKTYPNAEEAISYAIPAFKLGGRMLIYFAAFKKHVGMYPVPTTKEFEKAFAAYKTSGRGTIQFPLDKPVPVGLIKKVIQFKKANNDLLDKQKKDSSTKSVHKKSSPKKRISKE